MREALRGLQPPCPPMPSPRPAGCCQTAPTDSVHIYSVDGLFVYSVYFGNGSLFVRVSRVGVRVGPLSVY